MSSSERNAGLKVLTVKRGVPSGRTVSERNEACSVAGAPLILEPAGKEPVASVGPMEVAVVFEDMQHVVDRQFV